MKINLKNGELIAISKEFPMNVLEIQDTLDRLKIPDDKPIVAFSISEYDNMELPYPLCRMAFSADIYRLNLFAERLANLDFSEMTAFKSLLAANPECSFEDMLKMTYGLDSVMVYPCRDCCELGEAAIENEMIPELESCSDEIMELLDREKIGRLMQEREGGVFIDGYYCVTSGYEPPDINIEIGRIENCFFRLLAAPDFEKKEQAQWVTLPCDEKTVSYLRGMVCLKFQSSLPGITRKSFEKIFEIGALNQLSEKLSELSHSDFVKLKAVMESENIYEISDTLDCIGRLNEYDFDAMVQDESQFGKVYACRVFPTNFDWSILENCDMHDFGREALIRKGGEVTEYGAISGRGEKLYTTLTSAPEIAEEQTEDEVETEDESEGMSMGGML